MRIRQEMQDVSYKAIMAETSVLGKDFSGTVFSKEIIRIYRNVLNGLPEQTRNIFTSSRDENLTYNEIAEKYGITPRKVKREIQNTLELLRISLKDYLPLAILFIYLNLK